MERIKALIIQVGWTYIELPEFPMGVGIAVGFGPTQYTMLSVMGGGSEGQLNITAGILCDIRQDRLTALNLCNGIVRDNPAYPVYLHEAQNGWDILVSNIFFAQLLLENPVFFVKSVSALPQVADIIRPKFVEAELGGRPFNWDAEDRHRLFIKSML
jgi:hypothetical protein